jgi:hypothetical protein
MDKMALFLWQNQLVGTTIAKCSFKNVVKRYDLNGQLDRDVSRHYCTEENRYGSGNRPTSS